MTHQMEIRLQSLKYGLNLISGEIEAAIPSLPQHGIVNIFLKHTSAGLCINENASPDVQSDFRYFLDKLVPEDDADFKHTEEGPDDMPAHIKSSLLGQSLTIPIKDGRLALGTWQGIFLCEFRRNSCRRNIIITVIGE
ncbi:MAG: secondary thiamine-phosphate synthase enzyme YjbQ [Bacteroidales bacterium]|jgi:secondary thiamine-phosphate synthase enzyme|nr:secondary thiamine-phosphate synthase enzyme YjbQ [Bacteroidales bacterium]